MHCNIFSPDQNNKNISEDVFTTNECKTLKNI